MWLPTTTLQQVTSTLAITPCSSLGTHNSMRIAIFSTATETVHWTLPRTDAMGGLLTVCGLAAIPLIMQSLPGQVGAWTGLNSFAMNAE